MNQHHNTSFAKQVHLYAVQWINHRVGKIDWAVRFTFNAQKRGDLLFERRVLLETRERIIRRLSELGEGARKREILEMQAEVRTGAAVSPLIQAAVVSTILDEKRPGGVLADPS